MSKVSMFNSKNSSKNLINGRFPFSTDGVTTKVEACDVNDGTAAAASARPSRRQHTRADGSFWRWQRGHCR